MLINPVEVHEDSIPISVIQDIEKEIEGEIRDCKTSQGYDAWWGRKNGLIDARAIIDKHIAESEVNNE